MRRFQRSATVASAELAKALLGAWLDGEPAKLEKALERSCHPLSDQAVTGDQERLDLLEAVAVRLKSHGGLLDGGPLDPALVSCIDLLLHLAEGAGQMAACGRPTARTSRGKAASAGFMQMHIALSQIN